MGRILAILLFLFTTLSSVGQEYIFNRLSVSDGLASNFIHSVWQDKKGFIWIGTESGLQRYDGQRFIHYGKRIKETLLTQPIEQVLGDNDGKIWMRIGTTIAILDPDKFIFTQIPIAHNTSINLNGQYILQKNAGGDIFLIIKGNGWLIYNPEKKVFDEEKLPFKIPAGFGLHLVYEDIKTGNYWIGGAEGLGLYDKKAKRLFTKQSKIVKHSLLKEEQLNKFVTNFFIDNKRRFWIVNWDLGEGKSNGQRFYCFEEKENRFTIDTTGLSQFSNRGYFELHRFTELNDHSLLVYGLRNFALYNSNSRLFESVYHPNQAYYSIKFNSVNGLIQDKEDLLWIATDNGLYTSQMKAKDSRHIQEEESGGVINALIEQSENEIWVGTWGKGITVYDKQLHRIETPSYLRLNASQTPYFMVWDLMKHAKTGEIWAGCQGGRLMVSNPTYKKTTFLVPAAFENKTIRQIKQDQNGNCWLGSHKGHVIKWTVGGGFGDNNFKLITNLQLAINKMLIDARNQLWVATDGGGVYIIDTKTEKVIQHISVQTHNLPDNRVSEIIQYNDSLYFLGSTSLALFNTKTGKVKKLDQGQDNVPHTIFAMELTDDKQLWISTMAGIYKYNPEKDIYTYYNQWDGLISAINRNFVLNKSVQLSDGKILFGGNSSLLSFNPKQFKSIKQAPIVQITDFKLMNQYLPVDSIMQLKDIRLSHEQNSITIDFASINYLQLNKLVYYYKLEGVDNDWIRADRPLQANYTLLSPGQYTFMVKCQNEEGVFSAITSLTLTITPPFWRTEWFISLMILFMLGTLYLLHQMRVNRLLYVEKVRTKLSRDLHDDMGSTLSTINILSNMAVKRFDKGKTVSKDYLEKISENSSRIMEALDDIVWSINPINDNMSKVIVRMKEFAANVLESKDIDYAFKADEKVKEIDLDMEQRRNLFLIFKESLNNIAKYAQSSRVEVELSVHSGTFLMKVKDNGIGFDVDNIVFTQAERGNGIKNMYKRAEEMKGELAIHSSKQKGTQIILQIPIT